MTLKTTQKMTIKEIQNKVSQDLHLQTSALQQDSLQNKKNK